MKETLLVKDVMSKNAFIVRPDTSITECILNLAKHSLSGAPVADESGTLIGFVSEQDMLPALVQSAYYSDEAKRVSDVMQKEVLTLSPNESILQIANLMTKAKPKVYPVIEFNRVVGLITRQQLTTALVRHQEKCIPV